MIGVSLFSVAAMGCTTTMVGRLASKTGAVLSSHSDDGESGTDARLFWQPAADHAPGAMRDIRWDAEKYPFVGPGYKNQPVIGQIPEVPHTYARFSQNYGIINEKQVAMAESTCSAVFGATAIGHGGHALLSIDELSRIGLERCATSRCAVETMGSLAVQYGFYGAGSFEGGGESLIVTDPREGWIFQILPDNTGRSAIWAAQRVDDDKVAVVANMFTIREVNTSNPAKYLASPNLHSIARDLGMWHPKDGLLDFTRVYSDGEYAHKYYSGRRVWGTYRLLAPSANIPDEYSDLKFQKVYPTEVTPDTLVAREDIFAVHRSFYEGTKYDMTTGLAAGPWGNPDRWNAGTGQVKGNWERSIGLFRTGQSHVTELRSWLPDAQGGLVWFAPHCAPGSVFVPFCAGCNQVAPSYTIGDPKNKDSSAYWAHKYVYNVAHIRYGPMMAVVHRVQQALEKKSGELVASIDALVKPSADHLTATYNANAEAVVKRWWQLPDELVTKFADGYVNDGETQPYTNKWLKLVGFGKSGPPDVPCPPCPCAPTTSFQCSTCCGGNATRAAPAPVLCEVKACVKKCDASPDFRECIRECDRECA